MQIRLTCDLGCVVRYNVVKFKMAPEITSVLYSLYSICRDKSGDLLRQNAHRICLILEFICDG